MEIPIALLRSLDELVRRDLVALRDSYFHWLLGFTIAVAVGVVLEEAELFPIRRTRVGRAAGMPSVRRGVTATIMGLARIGWLLIVIGVIGEGVFESLVSQADGLLQEFNTGLLGQAQTEAARATERAAIAEAAVKGFDARIAEANARVRAAEAEVASANAMAADARSMAEHEQTERVRLLAEIQPRDLSVEQQDAIGKACRTFAKRKVRVVTYTLDAEAWRLGAEILAALKLGDVDFVDDRASLQPFGGFETGIFISGPVKDSDLVLGLARLFVNEGKLQRVVRSTAPTPPESNTTVLIGVKPVDLLR